MGYPYLSYIGEASLNSLAEHNIAYNFPGVFDINLLSNLSHLELIPRPYLCPGYETACAH